MDKFLFIKGLVKEEFKNITWNPVSKGKDPGGLKVKLPPITKKNTYKTAVKKEEQIGEIQKRSATPQPFTINQVKKMVWDDVKAYMDYEMEGNEFERDEYNNIKNDFKGTRDLDGIFQILDQIGFDDPQDFVFRVLVQQPKSPKRFKEEQIPGGLAKGKTVQDIARKHQVEVNDIKSQLDKGVKVEMEHTKNKKVALEIAMDHLMEDPKYYDKLKM